MYSGDHNKYYMMIKCYITKRVAAILFQYLVLGYLKKNKNVVSMSDFKVLIPGHT